MSHAPAAPAAAGAGDAIMLTPPVVWPRLLDVAPATFDTLSVASANELLVAWQHRLGPLHRPFSQRAYVMLVDGAPISLAMSASAVSKTAGGFRRDQVVELARLCSAPGCSWASRVMLRVWREVFARRWPDWSVEAAISYSQKAHYRGDLYRFDGWIRVSQACGSNGGGAWSRQRYAGEAARGRKTLWLWRYPS